jgi:S-DNA-T family DNA segregation ATPase FtsK/SpoIIIE
MAKKNKIDTDNFEPEKEAKSTPNRRWFDFIFDERFHKSIGLSFILLSAYLAVAFTSFLFTWRVDQSVVNDAGWKMFVETNPDAAENWMGIVGAVISHVFIHRWFGIASFAFVLIAFLVGFRILFKRWVLPIIDTLKYSFFTIIWISLTLGFICSLTNDFYFLGGAFGFHGYQWLESLLGKFGAPIFLLFYSLIFVVAVWNIEFYKPKPIVIPSDEALANAGINPDIDENHDYYTHKDEIVIPEIEEDDLPLNEDDFKLIIKPDEPETETRVDDPSLREEDADEPEVKFDLHDDFLPPPVTPPIPKPSAEPSFEITEALAEELPIITSERKEHYTTDDAYDPTLDYPNYKFPSLDLLKDVDESKPKVSIEELEENKRLIVETLKNYNIAIDKIKATIGPTVTLYEIVPAAGVRISKIKSLEDDIALSLAALGIRIIAPIPGKGTIGIEVPNQKPEMVAMRAVLASQKFQQSDADLPLCLGKTISNEIYLADLAKMPHLLMAGATGQGKSVGINVILTSLLYKKHPSQLKFVLVDPKKVELSIYKTIERHFLAKIPGNQDAIITDTKLVVNTLNSLCILMDTRYDLLKDAGVRNIKEYNTKFIARQLNPLNGHHFMPYIVVVIDELADLMMTAGKEVEYPIGRIAQLARAIGIHLILATQRPSVNVITGTIKANFPARAAFKVSSKIDSRTILDGNGADQLIGKGDMLISNGSDVVRVQCAFVDTPEAEAIAQFIGAQNGREAYELPEVKDDSADGTKLEVDDEGSRDAMFREAAQIIVQHQQGSTSLLQRRLKLGYNRAGRLIDQLERAGIVGPFTGSKAREVLIPDEFHLEQHLKDLGI